MSELKIEVRDFQHPDAQLLIAATLADLGERYGDPSGDDTPISAAEFAAPNGAFLVGYFEGRPVASAGWRAHGGHDAELKRLYTADTVRGRGFARAILAAVEDSARVAGRQRLIMELGPKQPEAIALYTSAGYAPIPHFGFYRDYPDVISLGKEL